MEFDTLYQELVNSTEMIRALIKDIGQEQAQVQPDAESWSILEVVCHLHDVELEDFREHLDFILTVAGVFMATTRLNNLRLARLSHFRSADADEHSASSVFFQRSALQDAVGRMASVPRIRGGGCGGRESLSFSSTSWCSGSGSM